jgi:opacity protein-like surface antigen
MKKILIIAMAILLIAGTVFARDWVRHSTSKSATGAIVSGPGVLHYILFWTDGATPNTVNAYDYSSTFGMATTTEVPLMPSDFPLTTSATDRAQKIPFAPGVRFFNGIYVVLSSTAEYMVYFELD